MVKPVQRFTPKALAYFAMIEAEAKRTPELADNLRKTLEAEKRACLKYPHWRPSGDLRNVGLFDGNLVRKPSRYVKIT